MFIAHPQAFLIILLATIGISLFSTLVYKFATNQKKMREIKERLKVLQKELREARGDQERMLKINSQIMKSHNEYSMQSMRSILFTFIPVMLVFIFLRAHVAYAPIHPGDTFTVLLDYRDQAALGSTLVQVPNGFTLLNTSNYTKSGFLGLGSRKGEAVLIRAPNTSANGTITFSYGNETVNRSVMVTESNKYAQQSVSYRNGFLASAAIQYQGLRVFDVPWLPGWLQGWLAVYIIFTLIFTNVFRTVLKVH